jgi:hypothetical protein
MEGRFQSRKLIAAFIFFLISAFGLFYLVKPGAAFRFAAKVVLYALPFVWIGAACAIMHFRELEQHALTLRTAWARWRKVAEEKAADDQISN